MLLGQIVEPLMVLSSPTEPSKPTLPVPISTNLPHLRIAFGQGGTNEPITWNDGVLDTAASLSTMHYLVASHIARVNPGAVAGVFTDKSFSPIVLSGIVQSGGSAVTTSLPVAFTFHTPYLTSKNRGFGDFGDNKIFWRKSCESCT